MVVLKFGLAFLVGLCCFFSLRNYHSIFFLPFLKYFLQYAGSLIGGGGGNHPEALQRLIDMELRANAKQVHPASAGHIPGIYGPEFDRSFRYR